MTVLNARTGKVVRCAAAAAAAISVAGLAIDGQPAAADPRNVLIGVGSDTTQDVLNGLAGDGLQPTIPALGGSSVLASFDAFVGGQKGTCITPKPGAPTFDRPNGSTNGRRALSRSIDGTLFTVTGSTCPTPAGVNVSGLIDFARSSSGPSGAAGPLMFIPMARDGLSFAYSAPLVTTPVTSLTQDQLRTIFSAPGPHVVNGVEIIPCSIQTGSGTFASWNTALGVTAAQMSAATQACTPTGQELQENDGGALRAKADQFAGKQVIIGFSAANFIAQSNGVVTSALPADNSVDLGAIVLSSGTNLGKPYAGTAPNLVACGTAAGCTSDFYANTTFGRTVFNVVQATRITGPGNNDIKQMFARTAAFGVPAVCKPAAQTTIASFGFNPLSSADGAGNCGNTSQTAGLASGPGSL